MQHALPGPVVARSQVGSTALGMEFLGGAKAVGGETSISTGTFGARDALLVFVGITGLSAAAHVHLRFNGVTTATYWHRTFSSTGLAAGLVTFANNQGPSATYVDLEGGSSTALKRHWFVSLTNRLASSKSAFWQGTVGNSTLDPTVAITGVGEWVNTTAQITSVDLGTVSGTLNADCRVQVYGRSYP